MKTPNYNSIPKIVQDFCEREEIFWNINFDLEPTTCRFLKEFGDGKCVCFHCDTHDIWGYEEEFVAFLEAQIEKERERLKVGL